MWRRLSKIASNLNPIYRPQLPLKIIELFINQLDLSAHRRIADFLFYWKSFQCNRLRRSVRPPNAKNQEEGAPIRQVQVFVELAADCCDWIRKLLRIRTAISGWEILQIGRNRSGWPLVDFSQEIVPEHNGNVARVCEPVTHYINLHAKGKL